MISRELIGKESFVIRVTRQFKASEAGHRLFFGGINIYRYPPTFRLQAIPGIVGVALSPNPIRSSGDNVSKDNKVTVRRAKDF